MENDNADTSQYATYVKTAATASLLASVGETNKKSRSTRLVQDIRNALDGVNFPIPIPFALDDDRAIGEIRALLAERGCAVPDRPGLRLRTRADVFAYA
jgi:hypothetical protein